MKKNRGDINGILLESIKDVQELQNHKFKSCSLEGVEPYHEYRMA